MNNAKTYYLKGLTLSTVGSIGSLRARQALLSMEVVLTLTADAIINACLAVG
jgi:hypothetical protein